MAHLIALLLINSFWVVICASGDEKSLVGVSYWTGYENDTWVGTITCVFQSTTDCLFSMHFQARRIDHDNHNSNEFLVVDCGGQDASVTLRIEDMSYEYVQLYTCMQDNTQLTYWSWLIANPMIAFEGEMSLGSQVTFSCTSFLEAPIYWVFPGMDTDNNDIDTDILPNDKNYTLTATFELQMKHNYAIIQCCMKLRNGQKTEQPCDKWRIVVDDSIQLLSTYENYQNFTRLMQCVFRSPSNSTEQIEWTYCPSAGMCSPIGPQYYENSYDDLYQTLTTTALMADKSDHYICSFYGVNHTFVPAEQMYAPKITSVETSVTFSDIFIITVDIKYESNPTPQNHWTKTIVNDAQNGSTLIVLGEDSHCDYTPVQFQNYQYGSRLYIINYYTPEDNNIYTFTASNEYGQQSVSVNTTQGPTALLISAVSEGTLCQFYGFPFPIPMIQRVLSVNEIEYTYTVEENLAGMFTNVTISITAGSGPVSIECCTFNQFNYDNRMCATRNLTLGYTNNYYGKLN